MIHNKEYAAAMEELQAENDALKAHINNLIEALKEEAVNWEGELGAGDGSEVERYLNKAVNKTPAQCLAKVQAKAAIDFAEWYFDRNCGDSDWHVSSSAEDYAANLISQAQEQDA